MGSASSAEHDQVLESLLVGPVPVGVNQFILSAPAPDPALIPHADVLGVTAVLLTCAYDNQEVTEYDLTSLLVYPNRILCKQRIYTARDERDSPSFA